MEYSLSQAFSAIRPANMAADRYSRDQARLMQFKQMYEGDQLRKAETEAKFQEGMGAIDDEVLALSEIGSMELQEMVKKNKAELEKEMAKWGDVDQFMRNGGAAMVGKYKNNILRSEEFRGHKQATDSLKQIDELIIAGKGNMLSHSTMADMAKYRDGKIKTFKPTLITPLDVPDKKYPEDLQIALKDFMGENYHAIRTNFAAEFPNVTPTEERLLNYTSQYYGGALGSKIDQQKKQGKAGGAGKAMDDMMNQKLYMFSTNVKDLHKMSLEAANLGMGDMELRQQMIDKGYDLNVPIDLQTKYRFETASENTLAEHYQMRKHMGMPLAKKVLEDYKTDEGGYRVNINDLYDEYGIYGGGVQTRKKRSGKGEKEYVNGEVLGVFLTKGRKNAIHDQTGEEQSVLFVNNKHKKGITEEGYKNKGEDQLTGHAMTVIAMKDKDTGEVFYMEVDLGGADGAGLMESVWGDMDRMDDDKVRADIKAAEIRVTKAQYEQEAKLQTNVYSSQLRSGVTDDLALRKITMSDNIYGGYIAGMAQVRMTKDRNEGKIPKGVSPEKAFVTYFKAIQNSFRETLDSDDKLKKEMQMISNDAEAKKFFLNYINISAAEYGEDATRIVTERMKHYMNTFKG